MPRKLFSCYSLLVLFSVLATSTLAQNFRGQIRGLILDQTGAAVPGATVTLANVNTGVTATKQTDSAGLYVFDYVDPGTYRVTFFLGTQQLGPVLSFVR